MFRSGGESSIVRADLIVNSISAILIFLGMSSEDEWYNKSLTALRMNSAHPANLTAPVLQYQS
jgi:hypothetical protein